MQLTPLSLFLFLSLYLLSLFLSRGGFPEYLTQALEMRLRRLWERGCIRLAYNWDEIGLSKCTIVF